MFLCGKLRRRVKTMLIDNKRIRTGYCAPDVLHMGETIICILLLPDEVYHCKICPRVKPG